MATAILLARRPLASPTQSPADLYAILKATEKLERAYVRDAIGAKEYEPACEKLIGQFRTLWDTVRSSVGCLAPCTVPGS